MINALLASVLIAYSLSLNASLIEKQSFVRLVVQQEKPTLNLYYSSHCPYSKKVLNYLYVIHKKVPTTDVQNNPEAKEYLKTHGGLMQVPCLFIDGKPLYESDDIIQWLSEHQDLLDPA